LSTLDWAVLIVYLVGIIAFGPLGRPRQREDRRLLPAGRQMRWWAVGLSVMATQISAITFIGTTGQAYNDGMRFLSCTSACPSRW
jgi:Na+/proline symporter